METHLNDGSRFCLYVLVHWCNRVGLLGLAQVCRTVRRYFVRGQSTPRSRIRLALGASGGNVMRGGCAAVRC